MPQEPEVLAGHDTDADADADAEAAATAAAAAERQASVQLLLLLPAARRGRLGPVVVRRQQEADGTPV